MASTATITTQVSLPPNKDALGSTGSGRLLSKLTRSPTSGRKHKTTSSINSTNSDSVSDHLPSLPTSSHSHKNQPRPELSRNTSAPVVSTLHNPTFKGGSINRTYSDSSGQQVGQYNGKMLEPPSMSTALSRPPGSSSGKMHTADVTFGPSHILPGPPPPAPSVPSFHFQQLHDLSHKRIATLEYMRKSHEGKRFWFNAVQFSKADISRLPSYTPSRLARRAQNYLLLGLSVPAVLDVHPQPHPHNTPATNAMLATEFLQSLNTLLTEFESYQQLHPIDGSHVSSLSRARIPQMFRRAVPSSSKPRKSSGASEMTPTSSISPPAMPEQPQHPLNTNYHTSQFSIDTTTSSNTYTSTSTGTTFTGGVVAAAGTNISNTTSSQTTISSSTFNSSSSFPPPGPADALNSTCLPNEGPYTHLLTPPLPFLPDFFSVFATLCDVLIDVYQHILRIVSTPSACTTHVVEAFSKTDARIRKVMVGGIVRDFEGAARESAKRELLGVQKVVLGGLMGSG